ncbi:MAG TPA: cytochrome c peroxidase [Nannocystis sp.]|jgi:cytochrome c peroxidase
MLIVPLLAACTAEEELVDGLYAPAEWERIQTLAPLPDPPKDPTNKYADDPAAAALGHKLFHEKGYSGAIVTEDLANGGLGKAGETGKISCASCHSGPWLIDERSKPGDNSLGSTWLPRNANAVVNAVYYLPWIENDGISDSLWSDALVDPEGIAMNGSRLAVAHVLWDNYRDEYNAIFDPDLDPALDPAAPDAARFPPEGKPGVEAWEAMAPADQEHVTRIFANFGKALDAYMRLLISRDAPFDRYVAGDMTAIDASAKRGLKLFIGKAACVECHDGPHFDDSDDKFRVNGLRPEGSQVVPEETGRQFVIDYILANPFNGAGELSDDVAEGKRRLAEISGLDAAAIAELNGKWRVKGLRQVAVTAPYMHTGQFKTLREVVEFYNDGGHPDGFVGIKDPLMVPLNLSESEIDDLVAFLGTLTGEQVPAALIAPP